MSENTIPYPANKDEAKALVESLGREFDLDNVLISRERVEEIVEDVVERPEPSFGFDSEDEEASFYRRIKKDLVDQTMTGLDDAVHAAQTAMVEDIREAVEWHKSRAWRNSWQVQLFVEGFSSEGGQPSGDMELVLTASAFSTAFDADAWGRAALGQRPSQLRSDETIVAYVENPGLGSMPVVHYKLTQTDGDRFPNTITITPEQ